VDVIPFWVQCLGLVILLLLSAFFSIAETSMMALNRYRIKALSKAGHRGALLTTELLTRTDRLLGMILIGNNLINAAASALVTAIAITRFGNNRTVLFLATSLIAFLIIVFAEITPKVIGATYPERIALAVAYVLKPLSVLFQPAVWFVNIFTGQMLRLVKITSSSGEDEQRLAPEELRALVLESGHFISKKQTSILLNLLDLESVTVYDAMIPRAQVEALDLEDPIEEIIEKLSTSYHNKLPVFEGELNQLRGILHVRKCLALMAEGPLTKEGIEAALAEAYFIPSGTSVTQQLQYFQEKRQRLGIVVDEYGEVQGLVTLEDIVEEIVGEFTSSMPRADHGLLKWDESSSTVVDGSSPLRELNRKLGLKLPLEGPNTLNGLILEELQEIPEAAVSLRIGDCAIEILQVQNQAVRTAKLTRLTGSHSSNTF
jgi:Mg2+/Co2+ transporter CorB